MEKLIKYMPKYYRKVEEIVNLQKAIEDVVDEEEFLKGILRQKFVQSSTVLEPYLFSPLIVCGELIIP